MAAASKTFQQAAKALGIPQAVEKYYMRVSGGGWMHKKVKFEGDLGDIRIGHGSIIMQGVQISFPRGYKLGLRVGCNVLIHPNVIIGGDVEIGNHCVIERNVYIGKDAIIGSFCTVDHHTYIGLMAEVYEHSKIGANCKLRNGYIIGNRSVVHDNSHVNAGISHDCIIGANAILNAFIDHHSTVGDHITIPTTLDIPHHTRIPSCNDMYVVRRAGSDARPFLVLRDGTCITGCFIGSRMKFEKAVRRKHGDNEYAKQYFRFLRKADKFFATH